MDFLLDMLNKDVMSIFNDYDKDTEKFDEVVKELKSLEELRDEVECTDDNYETYEIEYMFDNLDCIINNWKKTLYCEETGEIIYRVEDYEVNDF